ncbi:MAG: LCP family protein [Oscillospiraceae bacterium]|nr:LCP family protein [Oscillospiraceae bacterium]
MKKNNDLFSKPKKVKNKNPNFKYIVLSFSLFIVILSAFSAFLFMRSLDFDLGNIIDRTNTEAPSDAPTNDEQTYSVSELSGKSVYLLMLTDDSSNADFGFIITADFDSKSMTVASFDANQKLSDGKTYRDIYDTEFISGLKSRLNADFDLSVDKYVICTASQFKRIIASLGGVTVNVAEDVNYKSSEFNVSLDKGTQKLSDEYAYKYLAIAEIQEKSRIMCDILASALTPENSEKSDDLFKIFVNNCKTDISVIDYSNSLEKLKIYSNAEDKFYPSVKG